MHETLDPLLVVRQQRRLHPLPVFARPFQLSVELLQLFGQVAAALLCDIIIKHLAYYYACQTKQQHRRSLLCGVYWVK